MRIKKEGMRDRQIYVYRIDRTESETVGMFLGERQLSRHSNRIMRIGKQDCRNFPPLPSRSESLRVFGVDTGKEQNDTLSDRARRGDGERE